MSLRIHNSLTRQVERFEPQDPGRVTLYVCGPTVYGTPHIGNARPAVVFDLVFRLLSHLYPCVVFARNITDIDDKIIERARDHGLSISDLTARTTAEYHEMVSALGCLSPTIEPRATDSIPGMIAMIEGLIAKGHAYVAGGHVLFDVPSHPEHGVLSHHDQDDLRAGTRVVSNEAHGIKRHPSDFVLWKPSEGGMPGFPSPWGYGRPGWHIECSAMIAENLGRTIDIHGGGQDLRFPHHECEISQSACAHDGAPLARYFMHNGLLTTGGSKMAKSQGNVQTIHDLLGKGWTGEEIRFALLSTHYRHPIDWSQSQTLLTNARITLDRWRGALRAHHLLPYAEPCIRRIADALLDDFNTPRAIAWMAAEVAALHRDVIAHVPDVAAHVNQIRAGARLLGILSDLVEPGRPLPDHLQAVFDQRTEARRRKDWAESDRLRADLTAAGIGVQDGLGGSIWWWTGGTNALDAA